MNPPDLLRVTTFSPEFRTCYVSKGPPVLYCRGRQRGIFFVRRITTLLLYSTSQLRKFQVPSAVRFDRQLIEAECESYIEVETVVTRNLPSAITLERGIASINNALQQLKLEPPLPNQGVIRFQVAVPPDPKALRWFCCQPKSSGLFPRFFLCNGTDEHYSFNSISVNETRGIFGIGAAVLFSHSSTVSLGESSSNRRYFSGESSLTTIYGLLDGNYDKELSIVNHKTGSYYLIIPLIELNEYEDFSLLSVTLAWDGNLCLPFEKAIQSLESAIQQTAPHVGPDVELDYCDSTSSTLKGLNLVENDAVKLVSMKAPLSAKHDHHYSNMDLQFGIKRYLQFCFQLTSTVGLTSNMLGNAHERNGSFQDCANLNTLWASLLVEECCRLGLTYFCIAPGSRSTPLALAASSHPLTTCLVCFDERSLAFHAVGYARGSQKPAVIITTSGTAVSNLLPAVVEASQDFLPMILLTADRPPELQDVGANQSINQVNHFGSFVRFFFSLPAPSDQITARMVLTTLDSAAYWAMSSPCGPVHINCPFREPLDYSHKAWLPSCLRGLEFWMSSAQPFTRYLNLQRSVAMDPLKSGFNDVFKIIRTTDKGLLILGAINTDDEIWAALHLAKQLNWPVVPDILSGLRIRKLISCIPDEANEVLFLDHLGNALQSVAFRTLFEIDVIVQLGSRVTNKQISQMLEDCYPYTYILVDDHPYRYDPSHLITHRLQCSVVEFADSLLSHQSSFRSTKWSEYLKEIETMVEREVNFQIRAETSMTEPYVIHVACKMLASGSALFVGNSMPIRDADMYGKSLADFLYKDSDVLLQSKLPCLPLRVSGNRGASGIDGLISSAVGFAVGYNKRVMCIIGDVSFLHDTNGLAILNQRVPRKSMTIIVINNSGGGIFSFLPVANGIDAKLLAKYFITSHCISIGNLCKAHGLQHLLVKTKSELYDALLASEPATTDTVIEVESCIASNAQFHRLLKESALEAANLGCSMLTSSVKSIISFSQVKIHRMEYSLYRIQLSAPLTKISIANDEFQKEGYLFSLFLQDGIVGHGEVAPLDTDTKSMMAIEQQLKFIVRVIEDTTVPIGIVLLNGSFTSWLLTNLGLPVDTIHPSVRCGLEMAILNAIARWSGSTFSSTFRSCLKNDSISRITSVKICALLDSCGSPLSVAHIALSLVSEGFNAIKIKVARRADVIEDAAVIQEVRKHVGTGVDLRVDANRKWTYDEAILFGSIVKECDLQYIEEPVQNEDDIIRYHEESGLPVALDETLDSLPTNSLVKLEKYNHPGIVALVIKPSVVGGFEKAALIAKWAQRHGKLAVISSAFESSLSLSTYCLLSNYVDILNSATINNKNLHLQVAHGLGTYKWLKQDLAKVPLEVRMDPARGFMGVSIAETTYLPHHFQVNEDVIIRKFSGEEIHSCHVRAATNDFSCLFAVHSVGGGPNTVVFLHGFLGSGSDWIPIMKALSGNARCISIDLPGHGDTTLLPRTVEETISPVSLSVEHLADLLCLLLDDLIPGKATVVGYSMGARIALYMALKQCDKLNGAIIISGSPGLKDDAARKLRIAQDDSKAKNLRAYGIEWFLDDWYAGDLWNSLRSHPRFKEVVARRLVQKDVQELANVLSGLSIGRQLSLWQELNRCSLPLQLIVGEKDAKFKSIAREMWREIKHGRYTATENINEILEVPDSGHAVHLENPLPVVKAIGQFLSRLSLFTAPLASD